jgi:DNA/RNA endonuclease YhcR with UshA esterase domain
MIRSLLSTHIILLIFCLGACDNGGDSGNVISSSEAKKHVGQVKTVRGKVVSAKYAQGTRGAPTFMNLDQGYPNHHFTVVIWSSARLKFNPAPEKAFNGKTIRVTGEIKTYKGIAQIVVKNPDQIQVE